MQAEYNIGDVLVGQVHSEFEWGYLIQLPDGVTGRLPYDELSWIRTSTSNQGLEVPGILLYVKVIKAEPNERRGGQYLTFSLKRLTPNPWSHVEEYYPIGTKVVAPISRHTKYGAIVDLPAGLSALIHHSEVSWTDPLATAESILRVGEIVPMIITLSTALPRKLHASYRLAISDPWPEFAAVSKAGIKLPGDITSIKDFGVFVKLSNGFTGLIHSSNLSQANSYCLGDHITTLILNIDAERKRISLAPCDDT